MIVKVSNTAKRLNEIMQTRNLKQSDILELCKPYEKIHGVKMSKSTLSQYISGRNAPKQDKLTLLSMALSVDESWLMGFDVKEDMSPEDMADFTSTLLADKDTMDMIMTYYNMNLKKKKLVRNLIEFIKKEDV